MIIESLVRYYDILAAEEDANISKPGYSPGNVSFAVVISPTGKLTNIVDLRSDGKKKIPQEMDVPFQRSRAVAVTPFFASDNAKYIFGIEKINADGKKKTASEIVTTLSEIEGEKIVVSKRSRECFDKFRALHHLLLDSVKDPSVQAFLMFLDSWKPEQSMENPKFAEYQDRILDGGFFVFDIGGTYLHEKPQVRETWEKYYAAPHEEDAGESSQCLVTGKKEPIARIHQKIKGVYGAQSAGATLVGFNDSAFESYGKEQSYNAPIGDSAMFKYTTALNHLLARGSKNRIQIGDTTTVFWAETEKKTCENLVMSFIDPIDEPDETRKQEKVPGRRQDHATRELVNAILEKVRTGKPLAEGDIGVDPDTTNFYILGLSPNNARLAVRFWYRDNFGNFVIHLARHHLDMEIGPDDRRSRLISMYWLLKQTVPEGSKEAAASPLLGGLLMRSILEGTPYPVPMYNAILNRVRVERSITPARAGFIKACLIRMARARGNNEEKMITVSLNEESTDVPYRLGRLFAVLEKAQSDSNKDLKSTINSKYFSSASTTPAVVFPVLLKLVQHHIAKSDWGFKSNQWIEEVLAGVDTFPAYLSLEDQGKFMLGYYHQRKAFYKKKENGEEKKKEDLK